MLEPFHFLSFCLYAYPNKQLNFSQDRFTTKTKATGNCTLGASPLLHTNYTTTPATLNKLFIYSKVKLLQLPSRKQGVTWHLSFQKRGLIALDQWSLTWSTRKHVTGYVKLVK
jgi:hypothetical protein